MTETVLQELADSMDADSYPGSDVVRAVDRELRRLQALVAGADLPDVSDLLYQAWCVIANAGGWRNDDTEASPGWRDAAVRWRTDYHRWLDEVRP